MIGVGLLGELAFELKPEGVSARAVISFSFLFFSFLRLHLWHMEVSWLGIESELQLPACASATATLV